MDSKPWWKSKTVWLNVLAGAAELSQVLPLPPGTVAIIAAIANVGLRFITDQPVHVVTPK